MSVQLSSQMYPSIEVYGCMFTLIMGWSPFPFQPQRRLPEHVQTGKSSLTSGVGTFSLCFSRTQLLPLALSLECLGENKAWIILHLTNTRCPAQRPAISYLSTDRVEMARARHRQSRSGEGLRAHKRARDSQLRSWHEIAGGLSSELSSPRGLSRSVEWLPWRWCWPGASHSPSGMAKALSLR